MFSIYSLLFESFDYYYPKFGISGKLNQKEHFYEVLIQKYNEPAVILKVFGEALSDYSKLVVDEDEIYQHEEKPSKPGVPDYLLSVIGETESIGYEGTISWKYIEVVEVIRENLKEAD